MAVQQQRSDGRNGGLVTTDITTELHTAIDEDSDVRWVRHALERYYQRTPNNAVTHDRAWRDGIDAQYASPYFTDTTTNQFPQAVRLYDHGPCTSIMVVHDNQVRTTMLLKLVRDSAVKAYLNSLTDLHDKGGLMNHTEMWGESPTRIEQIRVRQNKQ